ncbi:MAG TPA: hypothetical protein VF284_12450 [Rhodanobacteraceae bacterium]
MSQSNTPILAVEVDPLNLIAAIWLACGLVLYGLTPLPLRDATSGWSVAFWLLAAPALLLAAKHVLLRQPLRTSLLQREASHDRRERRRIAGRRSAESGAYTSVREHFEHRRHASRRAQQVR